MSKFDYYVNLDYTSIASSVKDRIAQTKYNWFYATFYRWRDTRQNKIYNFSKSKKL